MSAFSFVPFEFARCYPGPICENIGAEDKSQQGQTNKDYPSSLYFLLPLITLWISNTFSFPFHEVRDTSWLLIRCFMSMHSGYVCVCAKNNGVCAPVCSYSFVCVFEIKRGTHTHRSERWLVRIIRTSNEMWWVECVYLTNADDQCPWSTWRKDTDRAWSACRQSQRKHSNNSTLHEAFKRSCPFCPFWQEGNDLSQATQCGPCLCSETLIIPAVLH